MSYTNPQFTTLTTSNSTNGKIADDYGNKYGTLYNYAAASANTYTYAEGAAPEGVNDEYDLCPSDWRLPKSGAVSNNDFSKLFLGNGGISTIMSGDTSPTAEEYAIVLQRTLGFTLSGFVNDGAASNQGVLGIYWSSSYRSASSMYRLYIGPPSMIIAANSDRRNSPASVRCIAK